MIIEDIYGLDLVEGLVGQFYWFELEAQGSNRAEWTVFIWTNELVGLERDHSFFFFPMVLIIGVVVCARKLTCQ